MIYDISTTRDISKLSQISTIASNNFEISLVVFMPNITTNHAITYTNKINNFPIKNYIKLSRETWAFRKLISECQFKNDYCTLQCRPQLSEPKYMRNTRRERRVNCVRPDASMRLNWRPDASALKCISAH